MPRLALPALTLALALPALTLACGGEKKQVCERARAASLAKLDARLSELPDDAPAQGIKGGLTQMRAAMDRDFVPVCMGLDDAGIECMRELEAINEAMEAVGEPSEECLSSEDPASCLNEHNAKLDAAMGACKATLDQIQVELGERAGG